MVNIINRLKKLFIKNKYNIIVLFLGSIYFSFLVFIHDARFADFEFFVKEPLSLTYGIDRWFSWSSRLLIESSVNIFSKNLFLWGLITIIFGAILFWSLNRILGNRRISQSLLMFSLLLLTNFFILTSAGIFATTINYLWPISCFSFVIAMLLRPFKNEKMKRRGGACERSKVCKTNRDNYSNDGRCLDWLLGQKGNRCQYIHRLITTN